MTVAPEREVSPDFFVLEDSEPVEIVRFMNISTAVDRWLGELSRKGRAQTTIRSYWRILSGPSENALANMYRDTDVGDVTTTQLRRWLDSLGTNARKQSRQYGKPKAAGTRAIEVTAVNNLFDWLTTEQIIKKNPTRRNGMRILERPPVGRAEDNDAIVSITTSDMRRLIEAALDWDEKLCIAALAYHGVRRHALALAKISDYDESVPTLTYREKGRKTIAKPVPPKFAAVIAAARADGVYDTQDWLIPNRCPGQAGAVWLPTRGDLDRDDRVVYRIVKKVAGRAGVSTHVHALRAAFAVYFLEGGGDKYDLQLLMGHANGATTDIYARRLDKRKRMESVLTLDWEAS